MLYNSFDFSSASGYQVFFEYLSSLADADYRKFHAGLTPGGPEVLGVRTPVLRKLAREILNMEYMSFLRLAGDKTHEELMLAGFVIGMSKCCFDDKIKLVREFVPKISSWAVCDSFCASLSSLSENREELFRFITEYISSDGEYELRFAIVMLMDYYLDDSYLDEVLKIIDGIKSDKYYVKMAAAWCLSVAIIKFPEKTLKFLEECSLDDFTYNKALQKAIESYRIAEGQKALLRSMKRS